jgi:hypothetical protein
MSECKDGTCQDCRAYDKACRDAFFKAQAEGKNLEESMRAMLDVARNYKKSKTPVKI